MERMEMGVTASRNNREKGNRKCKTLNRNECYTMARILLCSSYGEFSNDTNLI